jgi:hypothetical protein
MFNQELSFSYGFGGRGWKDTGGDLRLELVFTMGTIAKWLVFAKSAATKRNGGAASQVELVAIGISEFDIPFEAETAVVFDCYRSRHCILSCW